MVLVAPPAIPGAVIILPVVTPPVAAPVPPVPPPPAATPTNVVPMLGSAANSVVALVIPPRTSLVRGIAAVAAIPPTYCCLVCCCCWLWTRKPWGVVPCSFSFSLPPPLWSPSPSDLRRFSGGSCVLFGGGVTPSSATVTAAAVLGVPSAAAAASDAVAALPLPLPPSPPSLSSPPRVISAGSGLNMLRKRDVVIGRRPVFVCERRLWYRGGRTVVSSRPGEAVRVALATNDTWGPPVLVVVTLVLVAL